MDVKCTDIVSPGCKARAFCVLMLVPDTKARPWLAGLTTVGETPAQVCAACPQHELRTGEDTRATEGCTVTL